MRFPRFESLSHRERQDAADSFSLIVGWIGFALIAVGLAP